MNKRLLCSQVIIFIMGAVGYPCIEMLYRSGHTHWVMAIVGGIALLSIIDINYFLKQKNIVLRLILSTISVTFIELIAGIFINKIFKMHVWDYSKLDYNFCGQICLKFSFYWMLLCLAVIVMFEFLRISYRFFKKHRKKYRQK